MALRLMIQLLGSASLPPEVKAAVMALTVMAPTPPGGRLSPAALPSEGMENLNVWRRGKQTGGSLEKMATHEGLRVLHDSRLWCEGPRGFKGSLPLA